MIQWDVNAFTQTPGTPRGFAFLGARNVIHLLISSGSRSFAPLSRARHERAFRGSYACSPPFQTNAAFPAAAYGPSAVSPCRRFGVRCGATGRSCPRQPSVLLRPVNAFTCAAPGSKQIPTTGLEGGPEPRCTCVCIRTKRAMSLPSLSGRKRVYVPLNYPRRWDTARPRTLKCLTTGLGCNRVYTSRRRRLMPPTNP